LDRREADLDGKVSAVAPSSFESNPCVHGPRSGRSVESSAVYAMHFNERLWDECFDRLVSEFSWFVAEQRLRRTIGEDDPSVGIDGDDGVRPVVIFTE
jgi:hypothetical protein